MLAGALHGTSTCVCLQAAPIRFQDCRRQCSRSRFLSRNSSSWQIWSGRMLNITFHVAGQPSIRVHGQSRVGNVSIVKDLKAAIMIYYWFHQIPLNDVVTLRRGARQRLLILTPSETLIFHSSHVLVQQTKGEVSSSRSHFSFRFYHRLRLQLRPRPGTKALPYLHRH